MLEFYWFPPAPNEWGSRWGNRADSWICASASHTLFSARRTGYGFPLSQTVWEFQRRPAEGASRERAERHPLHLFSSYFIFLTLEPKHKCLFLSAILWISHLMYCTLLDQAEHLEESWARPQPDFGLLSTNHCTPCYIPGEKEGSPGHFPNICPLPSMHHCQWISLGFQERT